MRPTPFERVGEGYVKQTVEIEAMDIPTMADATPEQYRSYLPELFFVDHHDVLRASHGEYPIAVTPAQLDILIEYLQDLRGRFATGDYSRVR